MKRLSVFYFGFVLTATSIACLSRTRVAAPLPLTDSSFKLTSAQIKENEIHALDGSPEAANKLANYYQGWANDVPKAMQWYQIAAENGSTEAMWNYYEVSTVATFPDWVRRGHFWLKKAASMGNKRATEELQDAGKMVR
jgi:TPR repeat protein